MNEKNSKEDVVGTSGRAWLYLFGVALALWLIIPWAVATGFGAGDAETMGQSGDYFGSVNALFTGFAFVGLLWTIFLQMNQLNMQRQELALQREEMKESRGELKRQADVQELAAKINHANIRVQLMLARIQKLKMDVELTGNKPRDKIVDDIVSEIDTAERQVNEILGSPGTAN